METKLREMENVVPKGDNNVLFVDYSEPRPRLPRQRFRSPAMRKLNELKPGESCVLDLSPYETKVSSLSASFNHRLRPRTFLFKDLGNAFYEVRRGADRHTETALSTLLQRVADFLARYIVVPCETINVLALWVVHTWLIDAADYTPYVHITSPEKRCGKSRLVDALAALVPKAWVVVDPTAAALFRKIDAEQPTLLIDEVDTLFLKGAVGGRQALRAILNAGFHRGTTVARAGQDYRVFGPKVLSGIGSLPDTIRDRSIPIHLVRRRHDEVVEKFRERDVAARALPIREALTEFAKSDQVVANLRSIKPKMPDLGDRQQDVSEPLVAIADIAGSDWPQRVRAALVHLFADHEEGEGVRVRLLCALREIFKNTMEDRLPTEKVLAELVARETDEPWAGWWERQLKGGNVRGPAAKVAELLKPFGIKPHGIRLRNGTTPRGYTREDFCDAWERYCPAHENATHATDATQQTRS